MILYNKSNTSSFSNHAVNAHKSIFVIFSYMDGQPNIVAGDDASSLEGSVKTPLSRGIIPNDDSSYTIVMAIYFVRKKVIVIIILIR